MNVKLILTASLTLASLAQFAADVTLVDEGVARAVIVRSASAGAPGALAADELKGGIERLTGAALPVADAPSNGLASVCLALAGPDDGVLPNRIRKLAEKIRHDGFVLCTDAGGLYIVAREKRGLFYGVYEILKRYAGMRWLVPGDDGEYCGCDHILQDHVQKRRKK